MQPFCRTNTAESVQEMDRPIRAFVAMLLALCWQSYAAGDDAPVTSDAQIGQWIAQLGSEKFKVREQATRALIKAGLTALPAVVEATESRQAEVRDRAFAILSAFAQSNDRPTENAALAAAGDILRSQDRQRVTQAKRILAYRRIRAVQILLKLGARFDKPDSIQLSGKPVTDEHMVHLGLLTDLRIVNLAGTQITDAGLAQLKAFSNLDELHLTDTKISDAGLAHLRDLTTIRHLFLRDTKVTDEGLKHLRGMRNLVQLRLQRTAVTDEGLAHLKGLKTLKLLFLDETRVGDAGMKHLAGLRWMRHLYLGSTNVTDASLDHIARMSLLQDLDLDRTKITDEGIMKLAKLKKMARLGVTSKFVTKGGVAKFRKASGNKREVRHYLSTDC